MKSINVIAPFLTIFICYSCAFASEDSNKDISNPMLPITSMNKNNQPIKQYAKQSSKSSINKTLEVMGDLNLSAIFSDENADLSCMINGKIFSVSDEINGYIIQSILSNFVILVDQKKRLKKLMIF